ncbi:MAG: prepilin peptidase [Planctomycetales bacterium]|nr:prepilin peptidase [Planctomycetales bacterium]
MLWIGFVGGSIGSFLNVVVYRLPAGLSLVHPGSRCPHCGHAIRWYDNLPVLGWLGLRGRCRDCRAPISARYPIVEAIVMLLFLWEWSLDMSPFLPGAAPESLAALRPGWDIEGPLISALRRILLSQQLWVFAESVVFVCFMLSVTLIVADGKRLPWSLVIGLAIMPLTAALAYAAGFAIDPPTLLDWGWGAATAAIAYGLATALKWSSRERLQFGMIAGFAVIVLKPACGWSAIVAAAVAAQLPLGRLLAHSRTRDRAESPSPSVVWNLQNATALSALVANFLRKL